MEPNGTISITIADDGKPLTRTFTPQQTGNADACAQAIEWLAKTALPAAIRQDHQMAQQNKKPAAGFANQRAHEEAVVAA
jgi:hypothetical protein